jgi:hypothetical protein
MAENSVEYFNKKLGEAVIFFTTVEKMTESKKIKFYHEKVSETLNEMLKIPEDERTYDLNITIVNAALILNDINLALVTLIDCKEKGKNDPMWYYHMGLCFFTGGKLKNEYSLIYYDKFLEFAKNDKVENSELIDGVNRICRILRAPSRNS